MNRLPSAPCASTPAVAAVMRANVKVDTKPEVRLRRELHRRGLRFRKNFVVQAGALKVRPDIVFTRARAAVFVDGCFWHACPDHGTRPRSNSTYWDAKLQRNRERDRVVNDALTRDGWTVLRIWEHVDSTIAAADVADVVAQARQATAADVQDAQMG